MSKAGIGKYRREAGFAHWVSANSCCWQHNSHESIRVFPGHLFVCLCVLVSSKSPTLSYVRTKTQHCFVLRPRSVSQSSVPFFSSSVSGFLLAVSLCIPEDSNLRLSVARKNWGSNQKETPGSASQGCVLTSGFVLHSWMITATNLQYYRNPTISFWEMAGSNVRGRRERGTVIDSSWQ